MWNNFNADCSEIFEEPLTVSAGRTGPLKEMPQSNGTVSECLSLCVLHTEWAKHWTEERFETGGLAVGLG